MRCYQLSVVGYLFFLRREIPPCWSPTNKQKVVGKATDNGS
jgi:hypothetical protein